MSMVIPDLQNAPPSPPIWPRLPDARRVHPRGDVPDPGRGRSHKGVAEEPHPLQAPARAYARDGLPEAIQQDPRLLRGRDVPARRTRAPLEPRGDPDRQTRDAVRHGPRPGPLHRRHNGPHLRPRGPGRARRRSRRPRSERTLGHPPPVPGTRRPHDRARGVRFGRRQGSPTSATATTWPTPSP